jgi:hypothetical protein
MKALPWAIFWAQSFLTGASIVGYILISNKISKAPTETEAVIASLAFAIRSLSWVYVWARQMHSARYILLTRQLIIFDFAFFMTCLGMPIFCAIPPNSLTGIAVLSTFIATTAANSILAYRDYTKTWSSVEERTISRSTKAHQIDLDQFAKPLRRYPDTIAIYIPKKISALFGITALLGMLVGLNLMKSYPIFASISWGIPTLGTAAFLIPLATQAIVQQRSLRRLEQQIGRPLVTL